MPPTSLSTGATSSVRLVVGAVVMRSVQRRRVGAARRRDVAAREVERDERPRALAASSDGTTLSVVLPPKPVVAASRRRTCRSSTRAVTVQVAFVSVCEPAQRCQDDRERRGDTRRSPRPRARAQRGRARRRMHHAPTTAYRKPMTLAAETVRRSSRTSSCRRLPERLRCALPSDCVAAPTSVTASVSPAHAAGTRRDDDLRDVPAVVDVARRAERRDAARGDRGVAGREAIANRKPGWQPHRRPRTSQPPRVPIPRIFARSFISVLVLRRRGVAGRDTAARCLARNFVRRYGVSGR